MAIDPVTSLLNLGTTLVQKLIPDKQKQAEAIERMAQMEQQGRLTELDQEVKLLLGQMDVNKAEAENPNIFVAGWRPAIGWVCAVSLFTYYVPYALLATAIWGYSCLEAKTLLPRPDLSVADLLALTGGMLGISWQRTQEKINNVATKGLTWK